MEAIVHQAFGDVGFGDAAFGFERTQIDDTFVRDAAVFACIQNRIVFTQAFGNVVGVEQCPACRLLHALFAHHGQVHPSNRQDRRRTEGRSSNGGLVGTGAVGVGQSVSRCKRGKVGFQTDRADAWTAAAVGDTEGFVQVHVQHVRADFGRLHDADLGIEVGAVHVNLSAVFMNNAADVADAFFVHAVGGRVSNHDGGQSVAVLLGFGFQIVDVDVAVFVGIDNDDFQTQHSGSRRVGAVGGFRNQADVAVSLAVGFLIAADGEHAAVFALRAGVGLEGNRVKAGDGFQAVFHIGEQFAVAGSLRFGSVRVDVSELCPSNRQHFRSRVEFHGAAAQ